MNDEWLRSQFSFPLIPTNMDGVYTTPPLPGNLDLRTASEATLRQHGLFLPRPKAGDNGALARIWDKVLERGLTMVTPQLATESKVVRPSRRRHKHKPRGGPAQPGFYWCGAVLERQPGLFNNWLSAQAVLTLPYIGVPPGSPQNTPVATLAGWVGVDGWNGAGELFQAVIEFYLDQTADPPITVCLPMWQWWVPDPNDPDAQIEAASANITNPPYMQSGDLVFLSASYVQAQDGSAWGQIFFLWVTNNNNRPAGYTTLFPAPNGAQCLGNSIEWILENTAVTENLPVTTVPWFSATQGSTTPVTFTSAQGYTGGGTPGDPNDGFPVLWSNEDGSQISNTATVALTPQTVSITYTD